MKSDATPLFPLLSRRDFLKYCGAIAAIIGAGEMAAPQVAQALETLKKRPSVIWSSFMVCTGCAISLLQSRTPTPGNLILREISLDYHDNVMAPAGDQAEKSFQDAVNAGGFYYVVEGAIPTKIRGAMTIRGRWAGDIVKEAYEKAAGVIAIGSCATDGNIQAAEPNPTGALGVKDFLQQEGVYSESKPVINLPRCPGNGDDLVPTLAHILFYNRAPELDPENRPKFLYGHLLHDDCERRGHFEAGEFVEAMGDEASRNRWCLYKVGCKGPITYAPCSTARWNGHLSWCVNNGPCIGCAERHFWDEHHPFRNVAANVTNPVGGFTPSQIGWTLGAATVVGLAAHGIAQVATGRMGHGGPPEEAKTSNKQASNKKTSSKKASSKTSRPKGGKS